MPPRVRKLFDVVTGTKEEIHPLHQGRSFRLEHIVSHGRACGPDSWYDQPEEEWVVLIRGQASLQFKDDPEIFLEAGDSLLIPAHCLHRVASTSRDAHWIALHFDPEPSEPLRKTTKSTPPRVTSARVAPNMSGAGEAPQAARRRRRTTLRMA